MKRMLILLIFLFSVVSCIHSSDKKGKAISEPDKLQPVTNDPSNLVKVQDTNSKEYKMNRARLEMRRQAFIKSDTTK